jgi:hypothetical protein
LKWLTASLAIINIGFWMWQSWYTVAGGPVPAPKPKPEVNINQLVSLDAQGVKIKRHQSGKHKRARALVDVTPPQLCYRIGPFAKEKAATRARGQLVNVAISANPNESVVKKKIYRVYIPPLKSKKAVLLMQKKLTRLGFKDHAVIADKKLKNAISLGVYSVKKNANRRLVKLKRKKIKAKRQTITTSKKSYWLDVKTEQGLSLEFKETWGASGVKVVDSKCDVPT